MHPVKMPSLHILLLLLTTTTALADTESRIQYLANEGVAVFHEQTTLLFDPMFRPADTYYASVPEETREAIINGSDPFEEIAAVFVSHYHHDHFDPADMLRLMTQHETTRLYAPKQAVDAMRAISGSDQADIFKRVTVLDLSYGDEPKLMQTGNIEVEGFFIPHSGWPNRHADVENIAFRVTIDDVATVVHFGDADAQSEHFARHLRHWEEKEAGVALPPYWFFGPGDGIDILETYIRPLRSIGIHAPASYRNKENIPEELRDFDLFTDPGESRVLRIHRAEPARPRQGCRPIRRRPERFALHWNPVGSGLRAHAR